MAYQKKTTSNPVSNSFSALEANNEKPMDDLIDDTQKKMEAPRKKAPRKIGIWSDRKANSPKRNVVFSPETKINYFDREDMDFDDMPNTIEFGRCEFCLVTSFLFGDCSLDHLKGVNSCFRERILPENSSVKGLDLNKLLNNHTEFNKLLDDDVVRLVDDLSAWNDFPWGEYMWIELHKRIWLLETYPNSKTWWVEEKNVILRVVAWSDGTLFLKNDYDRLFQASTSSNGPSKKKKSRVKHKSVVSHTHVRTEVHCEVDVRTNVHHDVEEGLSVPELLKKISDMQWDFQSRITAIEQFVNHHKDFGSLTENPDIVSPNLEKPSCGYDVKAGNKESMCVGSSVKVVEQDEFDQNVADKNLIHDFDQIIEWKILLNDEVSSKNCEVPLAGAKKIAVDALLRQSILIFLK
nr:hypothetical protein [Tanacetum cinerariifolium]